MLSQKAPASLHRSRHPSPSLAPSRSPQPYLALPVYPATSTTTAPAAGLVGMPTLDDVDEATAAAALAASRTVKEKRREPEADPETEEEPQLEEDDDEEDHLPDPNPTISKELLDREKHYRKLNRELKSKTAAAVKKAEQVMKESQQTLDRPPPTFLDGVAGDTDAASVVDDASSYGRRSRRASAVGRPATGMSRPSTSAGMTTARPGSRAGGSGRPSKPSSSTTLAPTRGSATATPAAAFFASLDPAKAAALFPNGFPGAGAGGPDEGIGSEATIRLLKAKLGVLQEEVTKLIQDMSVKNTTISRLEEKTKLVEEERSKLAKTMQGLQTQLERMKKSNDELKKRNEAGETEQATLKKELEQRVKTIKQHETDAAARELKLNRALEEIEKLKSQLAKAHEEAKDKSESLKTTAEKLFNDNKRLMRQKTDLITIFKKQNQLIDILKRQKIHLESATLLKLTEQEFTHALNLRAGEVGEA
ncbi:Golgin sub A member 2 [Phlyctochytrium bullatum]|nr:Golgin sub A member 2 [Phlyctochytrium bullatum]